MKQEYRQPEIRVTLFPAQTDVILGSPATTDDPSISDRYDWSFLQSLEGDK